MKQSKKEVVTVTEEREVEQVITCDVCKKEIYRLNKRAGQSGTYGEKTFVQYWHLTTGHYDWGHNSSDSVETYDLCSPSCVTKKLDEYFRRSVGRKNTEYFELENKCFGV